MDEELSELQEALALVKVLTFSLFFFLNILNCSHQVLSCFLSFFFFFRISYIALVKEEDNSVELSTLMELLLGDLKKA